ncbi:MAG: helix-turn-helix transcriptional regulator [Clostridia bacterium]|nr:helix-turn-helix transcriptional regulator [Clostridia bacterium]
MRISSNKIIGERISKFRKSRGYTQQEFSEKINLSVTEISNLECGKNNLSYSSLVNICNELDVCPCQLLSGAIKKNVDGNIIDLVRELSESEQEILYKLLLAYFNTK